MSGQDRSESIRPSGGAPLLDLRGNPVCFLRVVVTDAANARAQDESAAEAFARMHGLLYAARRERSMARVFAEEDVRDVVVVHRSGALAVHREGAAEPLRYHPGTAVPRMKAAVRGELDRLTGLCGIQAGDHVLDLTTGLGADAAVFADAVGPAGRVTAIEGSPLIALLLHESKVRYPTDFDRLRWALERIEVRVGSLAEALARQATASMDVVYADPMFERGIESSAGIRAMRGFALSTGFAKEDLTQALRVARRSVVLKDRKDGGLFSSLGIRGEERTGKSTQYAVISRNQGIGRSFFGDSRERM